MRVKLVSVDGPQRTRCRKQIAGPTSLYESFKGVESRVVHVVLRHNLVSACDPRTQFGFRSHVSAVYRSLILCHYYQVPSRVSSPTSAMFSAALCARDDSARVSEVGSSTSQLLDRVGDAVAQRAAATHQRGEVAGGDPAQSASRPVLVEAFGLPAKHVAIALSICEQLRVHA